MRKIILALLALIVLLSAVSLASAEKDPTIGVDPSSQDIFVGTTGTYTITLNDAFKGKLSWDTGNPLLSARIDSAAFGKTGSISVYRENSIHTLEVRPLSGITLYTPYDIDIWHTPGNNGVAVKATATAGVVPIPELSTIVLMSAGLIGLLGLVRLWRNEK